MATNNKNAEFVGVDDLDEIEETKTPKTRVIFIDEEKDQPNFKVVGVNGKIYQIQRGVDVEVPEAVVEVLRNSVATRYTPYKDDQGETKLREQNYHLTPFRIVR